MTVQTQLSFKKVKISIKIILFKFDVVGDWRKNVLPVIRHR